PPKRRNQPVRADDERQAPDQRRRTDPDESELTLSPIELVVRRQSASRAGCVPPARPRRSPPSGAHGRSSTPTRFAGARRGLASLAGSDGIGSRGMVVFRRPAPSESSSRGSAPLEEDSGGGRAGGNTPRDALGPRARSR